jgi:hypothetical protein
MKKIFYFSIVIFFGFSFQDTCVASSVVTTNNNDSSAQIDAGGDIEDAVIIDGSNIDNNQASSADAGQITDNPEGDDGGIIDSSIKPDQLVVLTNDQQIVSRVISITNEQVGLQKKIETELKLPEKNTGFFLKMFGPDWATIKKIKADISAKTEKTQEIDKLMIGVEKEDVKKMLNDLVTEAKKKDASYQQAVSNREKGFSFLGWFVKIFY